MCCNKFFTYNNKSETSLLSSMYINFMLECETSCCLETWNTGANSFSGEPHNLQMDREDIIPGLTESWPGVKSQISLVLSFFPLVQSCFSYVIILIFSPSVIRLWSVHDLHLMSHDIENIQKFFILYFFPL